MHLFKPEYYVRSYQNIDTERLKAKGIRLLISDIDNTLVAWNDPAPGRKVRQFIKKMEEAGIYVALCSNSMPSRAGRFSVDLGVPVYPLSFKPLQYNLKKAMARFQVTPEETALIGDQLLTDMLGGNIAGIYTILTAPVTTDEKIDTRINRFFEKFIYRYYEKQNIFKKGDFDD